LSAHSGTGLAALRAALEARLGAALRRCRLTLPASAGRARARLYQAGAVIGETRHDDGSSELDVSLPVRELERLCHLAGIAVPEHAPCTATEPFLQSARPAAMKAS
jgi:GTPase